ncbi:MAG: phage holin family protein, partial [Synechococcus sp.]
MAEQQQPRGLGAAARMTALAASVMDLHVRIALQEVDR